MVSLPFSGPTYQIESRLTYQRIYKRKIKHRPFLAYCTAAKKSRSMMNVSSRLLLLVCMCIAGRWTGLWTTE
jgi:hypothetical protein